MSDCQQQITAILSQSLSFYVILQMRETLVFEDRKCPVALETLLSHIERDKSGGSAKGSDHSALQRRVGALLMPSCVWESVTSSHRLIWEQFFIFWHMKGKTMRSIFFFIYNCQLHATISTSRLEMLQKEEQLQSSAKRERALNSRGSKYKSASEKVTNICTDIAIQIGAIFVCL